jgi:hypothetical protein
MKAIFKPPREPYTGNLLWDVNEARNHVSAIQISLERIRKLGYWASPFPEGDGVTFTDEAKTKKDSEIVKDFQHCFDWLEITVDLTFNRQEAAKKQNQASLGYEDNIVLSKAEIAKVQLEDAIDLFLAEKWVSAITLAGAADGIFAGLLKQQGKQSAAEETWPHIEEVRSVTGLDYAGTRTKKDSFNEWNEHRNALKHHDKEDEERLEFNAFDQAYYSIQRANGDAEKLGLVARNRQEYENWLIVNLFT